MGVGTRSYVNRALKFERIFQFLLPKGYLYRGGSKMWKDSIRNIVLIFQTTILRIIGFYVRHSGIDISKDPFLNEIGIKAVIGQFFVPHFMVH